MRTDIVVRRKVVGFVDVEQEGTTRYIVTTHSGYRAELPMCVHDAHVGARETCTREVGGAWAPRCNKSRHCHSGHPEHVEVFVKKLIGTYK